MTNINALCGLSAQNDARTIASILLKSTVCEINLEMLKMRQRLREEVMQGGQEDQQVTTCALGAIVAHGVISSPHWIRRIGWTERKSHRTHGCKERCDGRSSKLPQRRTRIGSPSGIPPRTSRSRSMKRWTSKSNVPKRRQSTRTKMFRKPPVPAARAMQTSSPSSSGCDRRARQAERAKIKGLHPAAGPKGNSSR